MLDIRQPGVRTKRPKKPPIRPTDNEDLLELGDATTPQTVYVSTDGFGASEKGPFHTDGVKWKPRSSNTDDLFITFIPVGDITGISKGDAPTIFLSGSFNSNGSTAQDACAPMPSGGQQTTYHFNVETSRGRRDPIIVVTPQ